MWSLLFSFSKALITKSLFEEKPPLIFQEWVSPVFAQAKIQVTVLRADQIHPWMQGNKWYKLQPYLKTNLTNPSDGFCSPGGPFSNHLIALAFAAKEQGKQAVFLVRGAREEWKDNPAVLQMEAWGAQLIPVQRQDFRRLHQGELDWKSLVAAPDRLQFVPLGGSSPASVPSVASWAMDIASVHAFDELVLPVASAGTLAGFAVGLPEEKQIHAVAVLKDPGGGLQEEYESLLKDSGRKPGAGVQWYNQYHFGGYARHNEELRQFCKEALQRYSLPLEPIYSGKAFYSVSDLAQKGQFKEGTRILAIHTGGIFPWNSGLLD